MHIIIVRLSLKGSSYIKQVRGTFCELCLLQKEKKMKLERQVQYS